MAGEIYIKTGTAFSFLSSGGSAAFNFSSTGNGAGEGSARLDLGAYPRPGWYRWYGQTAMQATPTLGSTVDILLGLYDDESTPGRAWGDLTSVTNYDNSATWNFATLDDLRNLYTVGSIVCDAAAATTFSAGGVIFIPTRYITLVWWNRMGATSSATAADHSFYLTPLIEQVQ